MISFLLPFKEISFVVIAGVDSVENHRIGWSAACGPVDNRVWGVDRPVCTTLWIVDNT
jgi:hypothetical protein